MSTLATDPVCGMSVDPASASATATHNGQAYYFCCTHCQKSFVADPAHFLQTPRAH